MRDDITVDRLSAAELAAGLPYKYNKITDIGRQWIVQRSTAAPPQGCAITMIPDTDYYIINRTGEVREKKIRENRTDDISELKRTFAVARNIINYNCQKSENVVMLTLTYRNNEKNTEKVYNDWKNYRKRYLLPKLGKHEYITALEPQARGAWHMHVLLIFADGVPYIDATQARKAWCKGAIHLQRLDDTRNVGAYLSAYLTDTYDDSTHMRSKHARLHMYPSGCHIFRWSRGIVKPPERVISGGEADCVINTGHIDYQYGVRITDSTRTIVKTRYIVSK